MFLWSIIFWLDIFSVIVYVCAVCMDARNQNDFKKNLNEF